MIQVMESRNMYVLTILGCIVIIVAIFFSLGLDKIIIKPLIKNYTVLDIQIRLEQLESFTFTINILDLMPYGR
jgi:hypothetical protein